MPRADRPIHLEPAKVDPNNDNTFVPLDHPDDPVILAGATDADLLLADGVNGSWRSPGLKVEGDDQRIRPDSEPEPLAGQSHQELQIQSRGMNGEY